MKKLSGFIIIAAVVLSGCSKGYYDINNNPNNSTNASVDLVLANALKTTGATPLNNFQFLSEWMNYWAPSGSYAVNSSDGASYHEDQGTADGNGLWSNYYNNLEDYDYIEQTAIKSGQYFYIAAAKTMKAYLYQQLVDMFDKVPYTEALKGTANLTPKYDNGQDIYEALSTDLGAAVVLFQRADAVGSATQDVLFAGNNSKWAKFANTLRLRILMRQTQMAGRAAYIQAEINKIVANGSGFSTVDAGVNPGYSNSAGKQSPFYGFCINTAGTYTQDFWRACKYPITFCQANNDPRYTRWYAPIPSPPAAPNTYVGCVVGAASGNPVGSGSSTFGPGLLVTVGQPSIIMSAAESYFLQAEAGLRGWIANTPQTMFNNGVQASFTYLGAGSSAAYTSQAGNKQTNYGACVTFNEQLNSIIRQKWLANNTVTPFETWCDYRRLFSLGLTAITEPPLSVSSFLNGPNVPVRILYPLIEYQSNATNAPAQGSLAHFTSKVFWNQ